MMFIMTHHPSISVLQSWGQSVQAQDMAAVLAHYHVDGTLWPTLSNELRTSTDRIQDYFDHFLPKVQGEVEWLSTHCQELSDTACICSGSYRFPLTDGPADARFTYVVTQNDAGDWKISHHHSSLMPN
jgi:hypothetical protein